MLGFGKRYHIRHSEEGNTFFDDTAPATVFYVFLTWRCLGITVRRRLIAEAASREEALSKAIDNTMATRRRWTRQHPSITCHVAV